MRKVLMWMLTVCLSAPAIAHDDLPRGLYIVDGMKVLK